MGKWAGEQRTFAIKTYYKKGDSFAQAQRLFQCHFKIHRNNPVPSVQSIKTWVQNFEETGSTLSKKSPGRVETVHTPENVFAVREAFERSPRRSADAGHIFDCPIDYLP